MNTYLIPVTEPFGDKFNYLTTIYANTPSEAYLTASNRYDSRIVSRQDKYESYNEKLTLPELFPIAQKNDIMSISLKNTKGYRHMHFSM